jgi:hypothetical protein
MNAPPAPTPVIYPVNDTSRSDAERAYLRKITALAAEQDLTQDQRKYVQDVTIAFTVFAGVFVALRFFARHRQAAFIGIDDWLMVASFVVLIGNMVMNLMLVEQGAGLHAGLMTLEEREKLDQVHTYRHAEPWVT